MTPGSTIAGRFHVERLAASGGMASIHRAVDRQTGGPVALKVAAPGPASARLVEEGRILSDLSHPAIVRLIAQGAAADGSHWLALEWSDGDDLATCLDRGPLPLRETLRLAARLCGALGEIHRHRVVHRDVSPRNLLLPDAGVVLVDFGIALRAGASAEGAIGTPGYVAPEQARGDSRLDGRADLFSLGCVLFECLTGRRAFEAEGDLAGLAQALVADAVRARSFAPDVPVALDDLVARLLARNPDERPRDAASVAVVLDGIHDGERASVPSPAPRRVTTWVGREREMGILEATFAQCVSDSVAHAVIVTGAPGMGKSRLADELVRRLCDRGEPALHLSGRGDPAADRSAFHAIGDCLRNAGPVAPILDELTSPPSESRRDAVLLGDRIRRAWEDYVRAECETRPVVLVLDDLQWADRPSVDLLGAALSRAADRPLFVLALGRPEAREAHPRPWEGASVTELRLSGLPARAGAVLAKAELGDSADPSLVSRLLERADGNPLFLFDLCRAALEGRGDELPDSIRQVVSDRIARLDPDARRVLGAASLFGRTFWSGGVAAVLGDDGGSAWLRTLESRGVVEKSAKSRFDAQAEWTFQGELVREVALTMLSDDERRVGHRRAGLWLESVGEKDPARLADHFARGGEDARAVSALLRAAEEALAGHDFRAAIDRVLRASSLGAQGETLGTLRLIEAEARRWHGDFPGAEACAEEAARLLSEGSAAWLAALDEAMTAAGRRGEYGRALDWRRIANARTAPKATSALVTCLCSAARQSFHAARYDVADAILDHLPSLLASDDVDPRARAEVHRLRGARARHAGDLGADLAGYEAALALYESAMDLRNACNARASVGFARIELGDFAAAEAALERALQEADRLSLGAVAARARQNLSLVHLAKGDVARARVAATMALDASARQGNRRFEGWTRIYLSSIELAANDPAAAEREARAALDALEAAPPAQAGARAALARALLAAGRTEAAYAAARESMDALERLGTIEEFESLVRLAHAESAVAAGRLDLARGSLRAALARIDGRASTIADPLLRRSFLDRVPENARLRALAEQLR